MADEKMRELFGRNLKKWLYKREKTQADLCRYMGISSASASDWCNICFHDLRHYFASIGAVLGIPDVYLSDFGGWRRGSGVLKDVYQNMIDDEKLRYQDIMTAHFSGLLQ